jgi:hypothetical protein
MGAADHLGQALGLLAVAAGELNWRRGPPRPILRIAASFNYFPKFDDGDFRGDVGDVYVNTGHGELSAPDIIVGFDRRIH